MNAKQLAWDDVQMFLATARSGTLTAAAVQLGVNVSTVQRRIGRLEEAIGARLFDRSQRGYMLTPAGEELIEHADGMEREAFAIQRRIAGLDTNLRGTVHLSTVDDVAVALLPPLLKRFRKAHPQLTVEVSVGSQFKALGRRQADVALRMGRKPDEPDVIVRRVAHSNIALYASGSYLAKHGEPEAPSDLADHDVVIGDEALAAIPFERAVRQHVPEDRIVLRSNSFLIRHAAVRAGLGIGMLPDFVAVTDRSLRHLPALFPDFGGPVWMTIHVDLRTNARVRALVDFLTAELKSLADRFDPRGTREV